MRRLLLALIGLVGVGASYAQPTLYADEVLALIVAELGGTDGSIFLGINDEVEHPEHAGIKFNVSAHEFRVGFLEDGEVENAAIACGIGRITCEYAGLDLVGFGWGNYSAFIFLPSSGCSPSYPIRGRHGRGTTLASQEVCRATALEAAADAVTTMQTHFGYLAYGAKTGSWEQTSDNPASSVPFPPSKGEFESTVWEGVLSGIAEYTCETCTVAALEDYGVYVDGSYVDGGPTNPENEEPGDGGDPGGGGPGGWDDAPDDEITNCSIIDIPCNLRKLFVPRDGWGDDFADIGWSDKLPFALLSWMPEEECLGGANPDTGLQGCDSGSLFRDSVYDGENPGELIGGLQYRVKNPVYDLGLTGGTGPGYEFYEFDLRTVPYVDLWHRHMRIWLFWTFVGVFALNSLKRFIS